MFENLIDSLKRRIRKSYDKQAEAKLSHYLLQPLLALISLALILGMLGVTGKGSLVAAVGSSIFVVFCMPDHYTARLQNLISSHIICGGIGFGFSLLMPVPLSIDPYPILIGATAVALGMFVMVFTDTEHPPAAGTGLGMAFSSGEYMSLIFVILGILVLAAIKKALDPWLVDLV